MSFQVTTAFVQQYTNNVQLLLQQKGSKLRNAVTVGQYVGKAGKAVEQIGKVRAQKRTGRHTDTPLISTPHDARWVFPTDYEWADMVDDQDKIRMLIDPTSSYAQNAAYAMGRAIDDEILSAFFGTALTGENGTTSTSFAAANQVGVDVGGTGSALNVAKLRAARKLLIKNQVDLESETPYVLINASDNDALLNEIQVISADFNTRPVLADGRLVSFMGFNFITMEYTDTTSFTAANMTNGATRYVPVWVPSGMHVGIWEDIQGRIDVRPDKSYATQVYTRGTFGATRIEEGRVIQIATTGN